jgi:hypothetical protein
MDDQDFMDRIRKASWHADTHQCSRWCSPVPDYAGGMPPPGYWQKAVRLAASLGYSLRHDWHPVERDGEGCSGHTFGYVPPCPECGTTHGTDPYHICVVPGMPPGNDLFVTVHELSHAFLGHTPRNRMDLIAKTMQRRDGNREITGEEIACHLSGVAVAGALHVPVHQGAICYLSQRVQAARRPVQEDDQYAAFQAARVIAGALR